ncbi:MAG TPA: SPOR domain-containing protein [Gemmatimonadaceae bacterium]|nr:SPOR domain-containing protein [Gemmatimonadaceae bacterium]
MRRALLAAAVVAAACGGEPKGLVPVSAAGNGSQSGPDALVLRLPRAGGTPRVYSYTHLDSVVWAGARNGPAVDRVLAFDADAGAVAFLDDHDRPARIDFRLGDADRIALSPLLGAVSEDGAAVYGLDEQDNVLRLTPSGNWTYKPPRRARAVFPQGEGTAIVVGGRGPQTTAWKLFPPDSRILDSTSFPATWRTLPEQVGDRLYLIADSGLVSLATRTLDWNPPVLFREPIVAAVASPSGDRVFVATMGGSRLSVVDRYRNAVTEHIDLPGPTSDLRVDPLGRYLMARVADRDSAWVVAIGTGHVLGAVATAWRPDLPFVGPDGAIALLQGNDVTFVDGETLRPARAVRGGGDDVWFEFRWNGFRPRASSLDVPVSFNLAAADSARTAVDAAAADSAARAAQGQLQAADSTAHRAGRAGRVPPRDSAPAAAAAPVGYLVSFAALLSESRAGDLAAQISVEGQKARIVATRRDGTSIYRVVLGPYPTRDEAERVGRASQHAYWVYEATP